MSRAEWILGGILVVLLAVVLFAAANLWLPKPTVDIPPVVTNAIPVAPTSVHQGRTALFAFAAADSIARDWQTDAQLIDATATWPQGVTRDDIQTGVGTWTFTFYSAAQGSVAIVEVIENSAQLLTQTPAANPLTPAQASGWQIDSAAAINILLEQAGGDQFLRTQGVSILHMNLSAMTESGQLEWLVSLISSQTGEVLTMRLNAHTGEIIPLTTS